MSKPLLLRAINCNACKGQSIFSAIFRHLTVLNHQQIPVKWEMTANRQMQTSEVMNCVFLYYLSLLLLFVYVSKKHNAQKRG